MKKMFKKYFIYWFVFLFISNNQTFAQIIKYQYLPRDENMKDLYGVNSIDSMFIWTASQVYLSDSVFKFGPIICVSDTSKYCSIFFKLDSENNWYIIDSNKEYLFYDNRSKRLKCVYLEQYENFLNQVAFHKLLIIN